MSNSLLYRLIGAAVLLPGIVWLILDPPLSEGMSILLAFLAGACLGAGGSLIVTGEPFWESRPWWLSWDPRRQP